MAGTDDGHPARPGPAGGAAGDTGRQGRAAHRPSAAAQGPQVGPVLPWDRSDRSGTRRRAQHTRTGHGSSASDSAAPVACGLGDNGMARRVRSTRMGLDLSWDSVDAVRAASSFRSSGERPRRPDRSGYAASAFVTPRHEMAGPLRLRDRRPRWRSAGRPGRPARGCRRCPPLGSKCNGGNWKANSVTSCLAHRAVSGGRPRSRWGGCCSGRTGR